MPWSPGAAVCGPIQQTYIFRRFCGTCVGSVSQLRSAGGCVDKPADSVRISTHIPSAVHANEDTQEQGRFDSITSQAILLSPSLASQMLSHYSRRGKMLNHT